MLRTNIKDVDLLAALSDHGTGGSINVLIKLQPDPRAEVDAAATADRVIRRVADQLRVTPQYRYRKLDDTVHIFAPPKFVRALVEQPEVLTANCAPTFDSALIPPVQQRAVQLEAVNRPVRSQDRPMARVGRKHKTNR